MIRWSSVCRQPKSALVAQLFALILVGVPVEAFSQSSVGTEESARENAIFGDDNVPQPSPSVPANSNSDSTRDELILGSQQQSRVTTFVAQDDPLKVGGMLYLRARSSARRHENVDDWLLQVPSLVDVYLDGRPNDRVRSFILGRMVFDPTTTSDGPSAASGSTQMGAMLGATGGGSGTQTKRGVSMVLDQMWLRFDIGHTVFVTAGRQHVRWGTVRFWRPTDFLHLQPRDLLQVFDPRTGTTMLKLHLPWEERSWNLYAYALFEGERNVGSLGSIAGAVRGEIVLGAIEVGAGVLTQQSRKPKIGIDMSADIWDVDVYGELALRYGSEIDRVSYRPKLPGDDVSSVPSTIETLYPVERDHGVKPQCVMGVSYTRSYNDNDTFTLGVEYFYNALGYASPEAYPGLFLPRATPLAQPTSFGFLGRNYLGTFANFPSPFSLDQSTVIISTLGNLSDQSYISRLDYILIVLTHLRFEAYAAFHYGRPEGEYRMGFENIPVGGGVTVSVPPMQLEVGVGLRVDL
jgi:hypothetical protein